MNFKIYTAFMIGCLVSVYGIAQNSVYSLTVNGVNGKQYALNKYASDTLWIIILPVQKGNEGTKLLKRIDSISLAHKGTLQTIAIPSFEDGYVKDTSNSLMIFYQQHLDSSIFLSQPIYTHKTSGQQQDPLFHWLTSTGPNNHFNDDVPGAGSFYFIDKQGNVYGLLEPDARNSNKALKKVLP